ncbi:hypothetical protein [Halobaculum sp. MBLA0143]|uniref:hypothetical protein n=1 Tax=Halobaculum sp. MBLA0143 TaxID=3079933 RepID=UPI003523D721
MLRDTAHTAAGTLARHPRLLLVLVAVTLLATQTAIADPGTTEVVTQTEFPGASTDELGYANKGPSNP